MCVLKGLGHSHEQHVGTACRAWVGSGVCPLLSQQAVAGCPSGAGWTCTLQLLWDL